MFDDMYIGHSSQKWKNVEEGYHIDRYGQRIDVRTIDISYVMNLKNWYLRIDMSKEEEVRLRESPLFQILNQNTDVLSLERMVELDKEVRVATVKAFGNRGDYDVRLEEDDEVNVGDTVLTGLKDDGRFGYLDVGLVQKIIKTNRISREERVLKDVITEASETFIALRNKIREKEIKREIQERMKVVDKRQEMEMYAKMDSGIKELLDELDKIEE